MKELSTYNKLLKLSIPILLILLGLITCYIILKNYILLLILSIILISGIGIWIILRIYNRAENIYYDSQFLYMINNIGTRKIELNKIKRVKLTMTDQSIFGFKFHKYRIEFNSGIQMIDSVEFWNGGLNKRLSEFEKYLNQYSPTAIVEHYASTFNG